MFCLRDLTSLESSIFFRLAHQLIWFRACQCHTNGFYFRNTRWTQQLWSKDDSVIRLSENKTFALLHVGYWKLITGPVPPTFSSKLVKDMDRIWKSLSLLDQEESGACDQNNVFVVSSWLSAFGRITFIFSCLELDPSIATAKIRPRISYSQVMTILEKKLYILIYYDAIGPWWSLVSKYIRNMYDYWYKYRRRN